jgi:hypothetical protein
VREPSESTIALVWGAAVAAAADRAAAGEATLRAFASSGSDADAQELAATAVCLALRAAPAPAFAAMAPRDAEAVALARLLGFTVARIAAMLGVEMPEIRRRLCSGLTSASRRRTPVRTAIATPTEIAPEAARQRTRRSHLDSGAP